MPETSFVAGWVVGVLLLAVFWLMIIWVLDKAAFGSNHPGTTGCCDARHRPGSEHEYEWLCDRAAGHTGQHFDTFAKQAWS